MDERFFSTSEIAAAVDVSDRTVRNRLSKDLGRKRSARGGGWEYPLSALPVEWQEALRAGDGCGVMGVEDLPNSSCEGGQYTQVSVADSSSDGLASASVATGMSQGLSSFEGVGCRVSGVGDTQVSAAIYSEVVSRAPEAAADVPMGLSSSEGDGCGVSGEESGIPEFRNELGLDEAAQGKVDAWLDIFKQQAVWCAARGIDKVLDCDTQFATAWNAGEVACAPETRELLPRVSRSAIARQRSRLQKHGVAALAGKKRGSGTSKIDAHPVLREFVLGMIASKPDIAMPHLYKGLCERFGEKFDLPSQANLWRWVVRWKEENAELFEAMRNPDRWKGSYMVAFGKLDEDVERPNQRWELDSTPADILLTDGRYNLIGVVDVFTRRAMLLVSKTSKATAIAALMRRAMLAWGVPETIKTDNGKDYTSKHLTRCLQGLGIEQTLCPPFQPWQKGHIESFFGTFNHDLLELMPGYIGHNVAAREAIRARESFADRLFKKGGKCEIQLNAEGLQLFCDDWCQAYAGRVHSELGMSPLDRLASAQGWVKREIENERALDVLLAEAPRGGARTVEKKGIRLFSRWFIAPELADWVRQRVQVRFDPGDFGRLYVFDGEGAFICRAEAPELTGIDRQKVAQEATKRQRQRIREGRKALKKLGRQVNETEVAEEILAGEMAVAEKVVPLVRREAHGSAGLRAAADALSPGRSSQGQTRGSAPTRGAMDDEERVEQPRDRFRRCWNAWESNQGVAEEDVEWLRRYVTLPAGIGALRVFGSDRQKRYAFLDWLGLDEVAIGW